MIETVGDLKRLLADADDAARLRFRDPDTSWLMRIKGLRPAGEYEQYGEGKKGDVILDTEHYSEMRDKD